MELTWLSNEPFKPQHSVKSYGYWYNIFLSLENIFYFLTIQDSYFDAETVSVTSFDVRIPKNTILTFSFTIVR